MSTEFVIKGRKDICAAVGENEKEFRRLLAEGLPAFRSKPAGEWKLLPEDVRGFLARQRDRYAIQGVPLTMPSSDE